jgi:hypothetical protein
MRRVALLVVCGVWAAGCGGDGESSSRAVAGAASDETVQRAGGAQAAAAPPGADHARRDAGVLRGTYARLNGERDDLVR